LACSACGTLVSTVGLSAEEARVRDDEADYYGKEYWLSHQCQELGLPDIRDRARLDLPERCVYWLRSLLACKLPPARVLELGCAHGAFVALMRWAGYDAVGLELSPWVCQFAQEMFHVPVLLGTVEEQNLPEQSFDCVVLNDLLEHLPDPVTTLRCSLKLLKPDGILIFQTPDYSDELSYAEMIERRLLFLQYLHNEAVTREHLYLYSKRAARQMFGQLGYECVEFEQPAFAYDMYGIVSKHPVQRNGPEQIRTALEAQPTGRLVAALLESWMQAQRGHALAGEKQRIYEELGLAAQRILDLEQANARLQQEHNVLQHAYRVLKQGFDDQQQKLDQFSPFSLRVAARVHRLSKEHPHISKFAKKILRWSA
jgi:2-polyprenyl-3-methyl-5-hydroxy-6-metoxy-1,4-benzoquinol methylase